MTTPSGSKIDGKPQRPPNLVGLLDSLSKEPRADRALVAHLAAVQALLTTEDSTARPFLSVLLRTQGRRIEPLKDALLCLQAQTDQDFEVHVLEHDAEPGNAVLVRAAIQQLPPAFASRITVHEVVGGTRSMPLNIGIAASSGRYVAVYDDDDILFANWVEEFHRASRVSHGRLLRALVANQTVQPERWEGGKEGFRATSWPATEFPHTFDALDHLLVNRSPFMSFAFPRQVFYTYGLRFDEQLTVCEDWDMVLRGSQLCGVDDVPALTAIYRRWDGGPSSYSEHSKELWTASEQRVVARINDSVFMLPPGAMDRSRAMAASEIVFESHRVLFKGNSLRWPLHAAWRLAAPAMRLAVRVRNKVRRMRGR